MSRITRNDYKGPIDKESSDAGLLKRKNIIGRFNNHKFIELDFSESKFYSIVRHINSPSSFSGSYLYKCIFDKAVLDNIRMYYDDDNNYPTIIRECVFTDASLSYAKFVDGFFEGCDFTRANLKKAEMNDAHFNNITQDDVNNHYIGYPGETVVPTNGANFTSAILAGANLSHSVFVYCDFTGATFLADDVFDNRLSGLLGADVDNADFGYAKLVDVDFRRVRNVNTARYMRTDMTRIRLDGVDLMDMELIHCNLTSANFTNCRNMEFATFRGCNLSSAIFGDLDFSRCQFINCDFAGTNMSMIRNIRDAHFLNCFFTNVQFPEGVTINTVNRVNVQPVAPPIQRGVAYQIHNYFDTLDLQKIESFIDTFNNANRLAKSFSKKRSKTVKKRVTKSADFKSSKSSTKSNSLLFVKKKSIFSPLRVFVDKTFNTEDKAKYKSGLVRVLNIAKKYSRFEPTILFLHKIIGFVCRQDIVFIAEYVRTVVDETVHAYGDGGQSCIKGAYERIITSIGAVAEYLSVLYPDCDEIHFYKKIMKVFEKLEFNDYVQQWAELYLDKEDNIRIKGEKPTLSPTHEMNPEELKQHFINFMKSKYDGTPFYNSMVTRIETEADTYESMNVFQDRQFGG